MTVWAGIGSRKAPDSAKRWAYRIGRELAERNFVLSSGAAAGMDSAFEDGVCSVALDLCQIHLPWEGYNGHGSKHFKVSDQAMEIASRHHPAWDRCNLEARLLHARNSHIMLGRDCCTPVSFAVCWTPGGAVTGGTGQALRIAASYGIRVYNLYHLGEVKNITPIPF